MKPRYLERGTNQRDRWMVSYVDVLTILLIFFMVGAAKSLEHPPARPVVPPPPVITPPPVVTEPSRPDLIRAQELLRDRGLEPKLEARGLVISLPQVILFSSGTDVVSPQALPTIAQIADVIHDIPNNVQLIGYADTVPIHTRRFGSNWELSMARSQKILELLSKRYGVPEYRLSIASYGPYRPAAPNDTVDGRASNRRVEIVILDESHPGNPQGE
ncbi:MAG TPA: flagellar motor protein MotB [Bryobacteraceae bacterium]|jgi:chemotaxis protein MotB|nr:flagellar motor protein MotB [Bryobacteraceae bacterium]